MVVLGEAVPRFDLVMGLIGGSLTGPLMFILPPLFYARLRRMSWRARLLRRQAATVSASPGLPWVPEHDKVRPLGQGLAAPRRGYHVIHERPTSFQALLSADLVLGSPGKEMEAVMKLLATDRYPAPGQVQHPLQHPPQHQLPDRLLQSHTRHDAVLQRRPRRGPWRWLRRLLALDCLSLETCLEAGPMSRGEYLLTGLVVVLGVAATLAATFFSVRDTLRYATFTPPCLKNVTQASNILAIITETI